MIFSLIFLTFFSAFWLFLTLKNVISHRIISTIIAFWAGSMLGVSLLHIFPHVLDHQFGTLAFLGGFLLLYLLEELFSPHQKDHTHGDHTHEDPHEHSHHIALMAFFVIFLHTIFDGMTLRSGQEFSDVFNYTILASIAIHQIPVSLSLSAILKKSHFSKKMQMIFMFLFILAIAIGFFLSDIFFTIFWENFAIFSTAAAGGSLLYIATVDLLPMMHSENSKKILSIFAFFVGIFSAIFVQFFDSDVHYHDFHEKTEILHSEK